MGARLGRAIRAGVLVASVALAGAPPAWAGLPEIIESVRGAVVAVGTLQQTRRPPANFLATGFAVGDGRHVVTNAHVIPASLNVRHKEQLAVFSGRGREFQARRAVKVAVDLVHDLALLKIDGPALPALSLASSRGVREGQAIAFTGLPIGMVLGLYPVTHRGIVSVISPIAIPVPSARDLDPNVIARLRNPYDVFQLDATAYPGNSGSPVYDAASGRVIGVVNAVFVKETKEKVLESPSGITYAIPSEYVRALLKSAGVASR